MRMMQIARNNDMYVQIELMLQYNARDNGTIRYTVSSRLTGRVQLANHAVNWEAGSSEVTRKVHYFWPDGRAQPLIQTSLFHQSETMVKNGKKPRVINPLQNETNLRRMHKFHCNFHQKTFLKVF